ncbi:ATP-binding protein [Ferrimonas balearica]|uniref:ATP-binding protein n=1 Tax=Ferrimonas balearica TaxID=44012 RepID=UPI001C99B357|nr:ATP-binding protein [Ferrimonas balearica]MBY5992492.1 ATP-binding protein [Ferrimonas balearica]
MGFDLSCIAVTKILRPPRIILYGGAGIGKTTFGAYAPDPVFIFSEDGAGSLSVNAFPLVKSFSDLMSAADSLLRGDHHFQTVVIDSLDHIEPLIWAETCRRHGWQDIESPGYGKGYVSASEVWREFLSAIDALRNERHMGIIYLAHDEVRQVNDPMSEPYDRHQIKLHKRASELAQEWVDCVLFATKKLVIVQDDAGFNKKIARGVSTGQRVMLTHGEPAYLAKNRYNLPAELPLEWAAFENAFNQQ